MGKKNKVKKVLELFCGTQSVGKVCREQEWNVLSLDYEKKFNPTFCMDIMKFNYEQFEPGEFDIIWASPCCRVYSILQYSWIGRKWKDRNELIAARKDDEKYVLRVLEIINYLKPQWWFIENPNSSAMWEIEQLKDLDYVICDYCRFGYDYQKPTRFLTNRKLDNMTCNCENKKHKINLGNGPSKTSLKQRYSIPPGCIKYLFSIKS